MTEKFLDGAQIGATFQQVCCESVAECVNRQMTARGKAHTCSFDQPLNVARAEPAAAQAEEDGHLAIVLRFSQAGVISRCEIFRQCSSGKIAIFSLSIWYKVFP